MARSDTPRGEHMRTRGRATHAFILAGQILIVLLTVGLANRPAGRRAQDSNRSQISSSDPTDPGETPMATTHTRRPMRRRLPIVVGSIATILALLLTAAGVTLAQFSASTPASQNTFTAGTVTLSTGTGVTCTGSGAYSGFTTSGALPTCSLQATYSGSVPAYVALDILVVTKAGSGGTALYDGSNSTGLSFTIKDDDTSPSGGNSYTVPTTALSSTVCTGVGAGDLGEPAGSTCYQNTDLLAAHNASVTTFSGSDATTFTLTPTFAAASKYSGGTATVILTAHAAQIANNGSITSPVCNIGTTICNATGNPKWS